MSFSHFVAHDLPLQPQKESSASSAAVILIIAGNAVDLAASSTQSTFSELIADIVTDTHYASTTLPSQADILTLSNATLQAFPFVASLAHTSSTAAMHFARSELDADAIQLALWPLLNSSNRIARKHDLIALKVRETEVSLFARQRAVRMEAEQRKMEKSKGG